MEQQFHIRSFDRKSLENDCIDVILIEARKSYMPNYASSGQLFEELLDSDLRKFVTTEESGFLDEIRLLSKRGLLESRNGHLDCAARIFQFAQAKLQCLDSHTYSSLLARVFLESSIAYLDARRKQWDNARQRLCIALEIDNILTLDGAFMAIHAHKLQILHNWVRLLCLEERAEDAANALSGSIDYISGLTKVAPIGAGWRHVSETGLHPLLLDAATAQLISEAPRIFQLLPQDAAQRKVFEWRTHLALASGEAIVYGQTWIAAKQSLLSGDVRDFLIQSLAIFSSGRKPNALCVLWDALALDFLSTLRTSQNVKQLRKVGEAIDELLRNKSLTCWVREPLKRLQMETAV